MYGVYSRWLNALIFSALTLFSSHAFSSIGTATAPSTSRIPHSTLQAVEAAKLWEDSEWINLVHYVKESDDEYTSHVVDQRFFNAPDGKHNPRAELIATLQGLYSTDISDPNQHLQCRFISRFRWLQQKLPGQLDGLPKLVECPLYQEWRKLMPAHKVSLIFPAYHLNSPSSMFGHTLLRVDPAESANSSDWLSMAVNFGANIDNNDNSIFYAFKGLTGGYPGIFIVTPYFNKIKEYNRYENRDIWEYPLNLTPQETERMVLHLWELKEINFDYYFFDENCSYRLLELLEVARPGLELTDDFGVTAIPVDTVRTIDNAGLISDTVYRPSQSTNVRYLLDKLNDEQRDFMKLMTQDATLAHSEAFNTFPHETQNILLDAAYRYLRVKQNDERRSDTIAQNSYQLLQAINSRKDFASVSPAFKPWQRPDRGHYSRRFSFAAGEDAEREFVDLRVNMSFHSLEDRLAGFLEGAQINIGGLSIRAYEDEAQLQELDLIDIFSLTPRNQFFDPWSWRVYSGLEQQLINGEDHLTFHVTGGGGVTYRPWERGYYYAMVMARLENNGEYTRRVEPALGLSTGLLHHFDFGTSHLEISGEEFLNEDYRQRIHFKQNFSLAKNHSLQLNYIRNRQNLTQTTDILFTEASLSYHFFFR